MWHDRFAPNTITFSAAISAFEKGVHWKHVLELLRWMWQDRFAPDTITFSAAIRACEASLQWHQALELLSKLGHDRVEPTRQPLTQRQSSRDGHAMEACVGALARDEALQGRANLDHL